MNIIKYGFPKRTKYGNQKTIYNGQSFMSKKEANYCHILDILKNAKDISERVVSYKTQVPFQIEINKIKVFKYILDFEVLYADNHIEYIDVKGYKFGPAYSMFRLKKKCVEAQYGIEIKEV